MGVQGISIFTSENGFCYFTGDEDYENAFFFA